MANKKAIYRKKPKDSSEIVLEMALKYFEYEYETAMIQDLEGLGYEVSHYDKKIIDMIVTLYEQVKYCDKELKKEGLLVEVDSKIKSKS